MRASRSFCHLGIHPRLANDRSQSRTLDMPAGRLAIGCHRKLDLHAMWLRCRPCDVWKLMQRVPEGSSFYSHRLMSDKSVDRQHHLPIFQGGDYFPRSPTMPCKSVSTLFPSSLQKKLNCHADHKARKHSARPVRATAA